MKAVAKTVEPAEREARFDTIQPLYHEALTLVERLHRRLLDVIKDEFDRRGRSDINSVQALLLYNIGDKELTAGELRTRGYYLGSNVKGFFNAPFCKAFSRDVMPHSASSSLAANASFP